ncbi:hypothetical protein BS47DRAFT_1369242 [Hydnum rufescens UP504]|uniref:Uncharacterized protein n=1 Tax=Hydnum rufescens UP504 TaxID=1448309 RepID=A0A9P6ADQ9_9AGAM|nr:hypothetical protein BS47DRAFT_1369242 [Hydnum rufescens UP504]
MLGTIVYCACSASAWALLEYRQLPALNLHLASHLRNHNKEPPEKANARPRTRCCGCVVTSQTPYGNTRTENTPNETTRPNDATPRDATPRDATPRDAKPNETKPNNTKPSDAKPSDTKPRNAKPSDAKPNETTPSQPSRTKTREVVIHRPSGHANHTPAAAGQDIPPTTESPASRESECPNGRINE